MKWFIKVLRHYADFSGRARRKEYWMFVLFNIIFFYVWMFLALFIVMNVKGDIEKSILDIYLSYYAVMALPGLAVSVRRLHDIGKSGWMLLISLIPVIGGIWLFVLMVTQGQDSENQYGQDPKTSVETFGEQERLKSVGITFIVAASVVIVAFMISNLFRYYSMGFWYYGQIMSFLSYIMLLAAGIFLLRGTMIREIKGKTKNAMLFLLVAFAIFFIMSVNGAFLRGQVTWIVMLYFLSVVLFATCNLCAAQNKNLIRMTAIALIVFSVLYFLWSFYNRINSNAYIHGWTEMLFPLYALIPVANIVLAVTFYPRKTEIRNTNVAESPVDTKPQKTVETLSTPKPNEGIEKEFTLANLEKIRINTKISDILTMFGKPGLKMSAEVIFANFGVVPASERGKVYWTYTTPYGDFQIAVKDAYVVATSGLEHIIEKMKAELPEEKLDTAAVEGILKEDVRFSIESFQPVVSVQGFTKEEAYQILENYLAGNKPQKMSDDEIELLKPLFMNLLMHFRHEAYLYSQTGRSFGGMCDACIAPISLDDFYLVGSWARCRKCALEAVVSNLDWNYYLSHITNAIGQVPASVVSQAYDIKDKITKRRQAK